MSPSCDSDDIMQKTKQDGPSARCGVQDNGKIKASSMTVLETALSGEEPYDTNINYERVEEQQIESVTAPEKVNDCIKIVLHDLVSDKMFFIPDMV